MIFVAFLVTLSAFNSEWKVYESPEHPYSIHYRDRYRHDVPAVERQADYVFEVIAEKYGVDQFHAPLRIYLHPESGPTESGKDIRVGLAWYRFQSGDEYGQIHHLTPSAPDRTAFADTGWATTTGLRHDHPAASAYTVVHEVVHHVQAAMMIDLTYSEKQSVLPGYLIEAMADYEAKVYIVGFYTVPELSESLLKPYQTFSRLLSIGKTQRSRRVRTPNRLTERKP